MRSSQDPSVEALEAVILRLRFVQSEEDGGKVLEAALVSFLWSARKRLGDALFLIVTKPILESVLRTRKRVAGDAASSSRKIGWPRERFLDRTSLQARAMGDRLTTEVMSLSEVMVTGQLTSLLGELMRRYTTLFVAS